MITRSLITGKYDVIFVNFHFCVGVLVFKLVFKVLLR